MDQRVGRWSAEPPIPIQAPTLTVGFGARAKAYLIDGFLISTAVGLLDQLGRALPALAWIMAAIGALAGSIYFFWAYSTGGQTLGKQVAHIKVVSIDGTALNWRKGLLRTLGYVLSSFPLYLGFLWSVWDEDKQGWHDKIAGTRVVPGSATQEQVRQAHNQMLLRPRSHRWIWAAATSVALELGLIAFVVVTLLSFQSMQPQYHSEDWDRLEQALKARVDPDVHIPSFSTNMDYAIQSGKATDIWLEMQVTYDADCDAGSTADWCYRLANELVKIVFNNYPHIDEIDGIEVIMTKKTSIGPVEIEQTPVDDALTISEWRQRLSLPVSQGVHSP